VAIVGDPGGSPGDSTELGGFLITRPCPRDPPEEAVRAASSPPADQAEPDGRTARRGTQIAQSPKRHYSNTGPGQAFSDSTSLIRSALVCSNGLSGSLSSALLKRQWSLEKTARARSV